jgi:putative NADH-flavin reductase
MVCPTGKNKEKAHMNLVIFGATGKTGIELVKQALEKGHAVTAFVRDPSRLAITHEHLSTVTGDVFDPVSVAAAVQGQDAVICALGAGSDLKKTTVRTTGTINVISAMKEHDVKRLLAVTAMGVGESWDSLSLINKLFFAVLLKSARDDHEAQEIAIKDSGLEWTIIRPSGLTDTPRTGVYEVGENIHAKTSRIARADVADLIIRQVEQNTLVGKAVTITN